MIIKKFFNNFKKENKGFIIQSLDFDNNQKVNLELSNIKSLVLILLIIFSLIIFNIINFISATILADFNFHYYIFNQNFNTLFTSLILIYALSTHFNYYNIKINNHEIIIRNYNIITLIFKVKNFSNFSKKSLINYSIKNHFFNCNKILMLKAKNDDGKLITDNYNFPFLSKNEKLRIKNKLDKIISINNNKIK